MLHALFQHSLRFDRIVRYDEHFVTKLIVDGGAVRGVAALDVREGVVRAILGRAVILATGGAGKIFPFTTNGNIKTGDGMALAYREGVALKDMEFVQYHPTGLPGTGILITEATRGEGGYVKQQGGRALPRDARLRRRQQGRARPARHDLARDRAGDRGGPRLRGPVRRATCTSTSRHLGEEMHRQAPADRARARRRSTPASTRCTSRSRSARSSTT